MAKKAKKEVEKVTLSHEVINGEDVIVTKNEKGEVISKRTV